MYSLEQIVRKIGKENNEVRRLCQRFNLGEGGVYSENDFKFLENLFNATKKKLMERVRGIIKSNPYIDEAEVTRLLGRPTSYARWILTELSFSDYNLSETDDNLFFYLEDYKDE